jgi:transketolase
MAFKYGEIVSDRDVVGNTLNEMGALHDNLYVMTADTGMALNSFRENHRPRFIDVGIAEQALVGIAAGLALERNIPYIMNMTPFLTMRACEQIRTDVCYTNLPVRFIGTHGGLASGGGSTHYAMEDIALMRSYVNMTVVSVGDPDLLREILLLSWNYEGPMYIRLGYGKTDRGIYEPGSKKFEIGRAVTAREGKDVAVFAHGDMVFTALTAASELERENIDTRVIDMFSIKPIDREAVVRAAEDTRGIVVVEDHLTYGGLASAIADVLADTGASPKSFRRLGIPQTYPGFGGREELRDKYDYGLKAIIGAITRMLS